MGGHEHSSTIDIARPGSKTRVINVASGKGGVGKSTVAVNLACALSLDGFDVAILDSDVYGFSVPEMLGIDEAPEVLDHHILVPPRKHGVAAISMGLFVNDESPLLWRGPMLHKALNQFLTEVQWNEPDFLIVDTPPGTGDIALSMASLLPKAETYVVTTPQAAALRVAQRSAALAREHRLPVMGIIENMADDGELFGAGGGSQLATSLDVPLAGQIPLSKDVRSGGDIGMPVVVAVPESDAAAAFRALAAFVSSQKSPRITRAELRVS